MIQIRKTEPIYPSNLTFTYVLQNLCLEDPEIKITIHEDEENWYIETEYQEEENEQ